MEATTILVDPIERRDQHGAYCYVEMACWEDEKKRIANKDHPGCVHCCAEGSKVELHADLAASFKIRYDFSGQATRLIRTGDKFHLRAGGFITRDDPEFRHDLCVAESYTRDQAREVQECMDRFMVRANRKRYRGDKRGTTLNVQVGATGDDGHSWSFFTTSSTYIGRDSGFARDAFMRFTGVSGLSGVTIDSAAVLVQGTDHTFGGGAINVNFFADDSEAPTAPTTKSNHTGKTRTTASVNHSSLVDINTSTFTEIEDVTGVIQELADDYDPSAIQLLVDDNGSTGSSNRYLVDDYGTDSAGAAKLDIDYTGGGGPGVNHPQGLNVDLHGYTHSIEDGFTS